MAKASRKQRSREEVKDELNPGKWHIELCQRKRAENRRRNERQDKTRRAPEGRNAQPARICRTRLGRGTDDREGRHRDRRRKHSAVCAGRTSAGTENACIWSAELLDHPTLFLNERGKGPRVLIIRGQTRTRTRGNTEVGSGPRRRAGSANIALSDAQRNATKTMETCGSARHMNARQRWSLLLILTVPRR
ncbi:hypothetical protein ERJ75_001268800 [Trypanosoma vivax]|nr:hypothetical protein ERJ75_001269000 [Trypanosoma vivax]KAH8609082.1 hypothetical protein ERJ75_001268700 [Trypanosoma vivax]KAH8609160.1 hypothetical protein ERJ75_001268800 [Trypanosoma vivax]